MKLVLIQPPLGYGEDAGNFDVIRALFATSGIDPAPHDVLLLPEHVDPTDSDEEFLRHVRTLARDLGCHVVGGSHQCRRGHARVNAGAAVAPDGTVVGRYEKLRPYADERRVVLPGTGLGEFTLAERHVLVLVCADFWFSDLFQRATHVPDVVLVPALSVTRKPTPDYSRALWRHLAIARAYEYGTYVGISDWGYPSRLPQRFACGVGGLADPTRIEPENLFRPIGPAGITVYDLDFDALAAFRSDRLERGFFWKAPHRS